MMPPQDQRPPQRQPLRLSAGVLRHRPLLAYGLAVLAPVLGLVVRLGIGTHFPSGYPFLTFFPVIIIVAYLAGVGPGVLAALLSLLGAWFYLIPPVGSLILGNGKLLALLFFVMVAAIDITLIAMMQDALDRLSEERRATRRLYDQQLSLFAELQHRVANNMAFISGLLRLQKRRIATDPASAPVAFDEAVARIEMMSQVHRRLYDPDAANRELGSHLQTMCDELVALTGMRHVDVRVDVPDLRVALPQLLPLSLVIAETVTNSLKHGFRGRELGRIAITSEVGSDGAVTVIVRDDGIGLPADFAVGQSSGLGMRIVDGLVRQIGGTIATGNDGGTLTRITLPPVADRASAANDDRAGNTGDALAPTAA